MRRVCIGLLIIACACRASSPRAEPDKEATKASAELAFAAKGVKPAQPHTPSRLLAQPLHFNTELGYDPTQAAHMPLIQSSLVKLNP